ncbi:MAG: hypothetical protein OHK0011_08870 [Turneriella sp.]
MPGVLITIPLAVTKDCQKRGAWRLFQPRQAVKIGYKSPITDFAHRSIPYFPGEEPDNPVGKIISAVSHYPATALNILRGYYKKTPVFWSLISRLA